MKKTLNIENIKQPGTRLFLNQGRDMNSSPASQSKRQPNPAESGAFRLFSSFVEQEPAGADLMPKRQDSKQKEIQTLFEGLCATMAENKIGTIIQQYSFFETQTKGSGYRAKEIEKFAMLLEEQQYNKEHALCSGLFLSALMNNSPDEKFVLRLGTLATPLEGVGFYNTGKIISVFGNLGRLSAYRMSATGQMHVNGDCGDETGEFLSGDSILSVSGNCGNSSGLQMSGNSTMIVQGNCVSAGENNYGNSIMEVFGGCHIAGRHMNGNALLIVRGDCSSAGEGMSGRSKMIVLGNVGVLAGQSMYGNSKLTIHGNAEGGVGQDSMYNAKIEVFGNCGSAGMRDRSRLIVHGKVLNEQ